MAVACLLGTMVGTLITPTAQAAEPAHSYLVKSDANTREDRSTTARIRGKVFHVERVQLLCQDRGESVKGSDLWDLVQYQVDGTDGLTKILWMHDNLLDTDRTGPVPDVRQGNCPTIRAAAGVPIPAPPVIDPPTLRPACDESRFQQAVTFISGEMLTNQISKTFLTIRALNYPTRLVPERFRAPNSTAAALFAEKVWPHHDWDHKDALQQLLPVDPNSPEDRMLQICGEVNLRLNYDYFSNMHYGYIGNKAYFTDHVLLTAQRLVAIDDPADRIAIQVGIDMARQTSNPHADTVRQSIIQSLPGAVAQGYSGLVRP